MSMPDHQDQINAFVREFFTKDSPRPNGNGHHKNASPVVEDRQIIALCRKAKNAAKFADLFDDGDTSGYGSASEADAALISIPAFYTQDAEQLDRIYRRSALMRPKWDRSDYRERTIQFVLDNLTETYIPSGSGSGSPICVRTGTGTDEAANDTPKLVKFRDIERKDRPKDIVEGLIPANSMTLCYGAGGVAKSYIALDIGMAVAGVADEWLGFAVEHGAVVFGDFELDSSEHGWRSQKLLAGHKKCDELPHDFYYMELAARKPRQAFDALYTACVEVGAKLLIVDSLTVALEGDVEVARDFIGFVNHQIGRLRKAGVSTLALDHQGKLQSGERYQQKTAFGTSFKRHLARSYAQLESRDHGDGFLDLTFRHQKQNFAPLVDPFGIRVDFEPEKVTVTKEELEEGELAGEETINAQERVYKAIKSFENAEGTKRDVVEATGLAEGTVKKEIAALKNEAPPRVWDTGRVEGRMAIVTTEQPSDPDPEPPKPTGSGSDTYRGTGTGTGEHDAQIPLAYDLKPGESGIVADLEKRRKENPNWKGEL